MESLSRDMATTAVAWRDLRPLSTSPSTSTCARKDVFLFPFSLHALFFDVETKRSLGGSCLASWNAWGNEEAFHTARPAPPLSAWCMVWACQAIWYLSYRSTRLDRGVRVTLNLGRGNIKGMFIRDETMQSILDG